MSTESARDRKERFIKCAPGTIQSGTTDDLHRPQRLPRVDHPARSRGTTHRQIRFLRVGPYGESIRNFACYNARTDPLFLFPSSFKTVSLLRVSRAAKSLGFVEYQVSQHLSIRSNFCSEFLLERFITCVLGKRHRVQRIASNLCWTDSENGGGQNFKQVNCFVIRTRPGVNPGAPGRDVIPRDCIAAAREDRKHTVRFAYSLLFISNETTAATAIRSI